MHWLTTRNQYGATAKDLMEPNDQEILVVLQRSRTADEVKALVF